VKVFDVPREEHTAFLGAVPRALTSTAASSPDSTAIIGFGPNRNSSAVPTISDSYVDISRTPLSSSAVYYGPLRTTFLGSGVEPENV
jgi:hypothetical protein